jgi:hypothetical protein
MGRERILYQDWIVALGRDPSIKGDDTNPRSIGYNSSIVLAVNRALSSLDHDEASLIRAIYMQGMEFREVSEITGRAVYRLEAVHHRALKKLKRYLYDILKGKFNIPRPHDPACPLCNHPDIMEINRLICTKSKRETWRRIMKLLNDRHNLKLATPQRLVGHQKYHITPEEGP